MNRDKLCRISLGLMAFVYVMAGINHFWHPKFYQPIMPPFIPWPDVMIALSGVIEIILGLALIPLKTRKPAARAIFAMLVAFMSVHIYMWSERNGTFADIPTWILFVRMPLQLVLMAWAYNCSKLTMNLLKR